MKRRPFNPYFDKGLRRWIVKTAHKHYWRVAGWQDLDDLVQEGFWMFARCHDRYKGAVQNKAHFMALFKISYLNHITTLANKRTQQVDVPISSLIGPETQPLAALEYLGGTEDGDAELAATLLSAPTEIQALLLLLHDPEFSAYVRQGSSKREGGVRETTNQHLCRLLGLPLETNLESKLRELLAA